jgi:hypothetical protein
MPSRLLTPPAVEPLSLDDSKAYLRIAILRCFARVSFQESACRCRLTSRIRGLSKMKF